MVSSQSATHHIIIATVQKFSNNLNSIFIFCRPDGRTYDGEWLNGKQHGQAIYTNASGQRKRGTWLEGKKNGELIPILADDQGTLNNETKQNV